MKKTRLLIYLVLISIVLVNTTNLIIEREKIISKKNKIESTLEREITYREKNDTYDGILVIPKISLKGGIYKITDKRNNIEENIMIHYASTYPDQDESNIIFIAHSGSGTKAFFKDLDKLDFDSLIDFYYKHIKYTYKIANIYSIEKNGSTLLDRDKHKKTITLITCDSKDKTKQIVYIGYLIDEVRY